MPDRRFIFDWESLIRFARRAFLEAAIAKQPVLGGVGVSFANDPLPLESVGIILIPGIVTLPTSDDAPNGWGQPFPPLPLGTPGGTNPEVIFTKDDITSDITVSRSDTWFPSFGGVAMENIAGGSDWQSSDGSITISYGDLDNNRYHASPGETVFKDGLELTDTLSAYTTGLIAICADITESAYLIATTSANGALGTTITVTAVFMTDTTLTTVDTEQTPQTVLTYDTNDLNDSVESSVVISANFSPGADKFVATVANGGFVEFSIASLVGSVETEKNVLTATDRAYQSGEITNHGVEFQSINEFLTCSVQSISGGTAWRYTFNQRRLERFVNRITMTKGDIVFVLASDFDQSTNNRVDLELTVSGTKEHLESVSGGYFETITNGIVVDTPIGSDPNGDLCGTDPPTLFGTTGASVVNPGTVVLDTDTFEKCTDTGAVTTLSIGGNVIATAQQLKDVEHTQFTVPSNPDIQYANSTIWDFDRIFDADLRTGYVSFTNVKLFWDTVNYTGSGTVNMQEDRYFVIEGGQYLADDSNIDTFNTTPVIGLGTGPYVIRDFEEKCDDFNPNLALYRTVFTSGIPSLSRFNSKTQTGSSAYQHPDHQMAYSNLEHERGGSYEYQEYTDGDPVALSEITGANPKVDPKGVI